VYVAARILETDLNLARGSLLGYFPDGGLGALCWVSANVVPVECDPEAAAAFAGRMRRHQQQCSSVFGPAGQVEALWLELRRHWTSPLQVRARQPLLAMSPDRPLGVAPDPRVRRARLDELALVAPAATAMFTEEIGFAPYVDRLGRQGYWSSVRALIARGRSYVIVDRGEVVFKADVGSAGIGACQIQGVWVTPGRRGQGIAGPAMAAVVELARAEVAPLVTLYVNDYNTQALATYRRVGFVEVGLFATVLI
jgi:ribosomal protein S18 acetylase RimI-like enzyme